ncbi:TPA: hypothetical protein HA244_02610 [Candidatus Micrarchaeota archaeon]|nr:hypothetical protein [Candidatus Micrarchaeota archaeon]
MERRKKVFPDAEMGTSQGISVPRICLSTASKNMGLIRRVKGMLRAKGVKGFSEGGTSIGGVHSVKILISPDTLQGKDFERITSLPPHLTEIAAGI